MDHPNIIKVSPITRPRPVDHWGIDMESCVAGHRAMRCGRMKTQRGKAANISAITTLFPSFWTVAICSKGPPVRSCDDVSNRMIELDRVNNPEPATDGAPAGSSRSGQCRYTGRNPAKPAVPQTLTHGPQVDAVRFYTAELLSAVSV